MISRWVRADGRERAVALALAIVVFGCAFAVYARTAAPSVMSGDSGEFQFAAPLLGVPHPTGYPLYILLGKLATLGSPKDVAHRVTLVSAVAAAGGVAFLALLALGITRNTLAALIAAIAVAAAPGLWNAATMAEVYALNTLLMTLLAWTLWKVRGGGRGIGGGGRDNEDRGPRPENALSIHSDPPSPIPHPLSPNSYLPTPISHQLRWLYTAAFVTGLGISHHGSFAFIAAPLFLGYGLLPLWHDSWRQYANGERHWRNYLLPSAFCLLFGLLGLSPWLFIPLQYARFGPFYGLDYGLPRAYFWGSPTSWSAALNHIDGGVMRVGVFRAPDGPTLVAATLTLARRVRFEFGTWGLWLGAFGSLALLWRNWRVWLGSAWVAGVTALYFASLTAAVQDAPVFTLPLMLPWALWIGVGAAVFAQAADRLVLRVRPARADDAIQRARAVLVRPSWVILLGLLAVSLWWAHSRLPYGNKSDQWLFRSFGEGALARMEPHAAVLVRWEQGTILQYLRLIEHDRPDVTIDIVEPENDPWLPRARHRYAGRPVYIIGSPDDGANLHAQRVWGTDYATLFRLPLDGQ